MRARTETESCASSPRDLQREQLAARYRLQKWIPREGRSVGTPPQMTRATRESSGSGEIQARESSGSGEIQ
ncbi:MAG: hypothetical protein ACK56I_26125, partial [bacterium]